MANTYLGLPNKWVPPGVYVAQLYQPKLNADTTYRRIPCYVGIGAPNLFHQAQAVVRGYIYSESLIFTTRSPFRAMLKHKALGSKETAVFLTGSGESVDDRTWSFVKNEAGEFVGVEINAATFDSTQTYILSYQSADPKALDDTALVDLESLVQVGLRAGSKDFFPEDYWLETKMGRFAIGSSIFGTAANEGTGDLPQITVDSVYQGPTREYALSVDASLDVELPQVVSVVPGEANTGSGQLSFNVDNWTGATDTVYTLTVNEVSEDGNTLTLGWARDLPVQSGTIVIRRGFDSNVSFIDGIVLDSNDLTLYKKDDVLVYTLGVRQTPQITLSWVSDDVNGGAGDLTVSASNRNNVKWTAGMSLIFGSVLTGYKVGDTFSLIVTSTGRVEWKYDLKDLQNFDLNDLSFDQTGAITGTRRSWYAVLSNANVQSVEGIKLTAKGKPDVVVTPDKFKFIDGTSYVVFAEKPVGEFAVVSYTYTNSPAYGQTYYIDAYAKKPAESYNQVLFLTKDNYVLHTGAASATNHLRIMAELALNDVGVDQISIVQVRDSDRDGKFTTADYRTAIQSIREVKSVTDIIVLGKIEALGDTIYEIEQRNDPFRSSETLGWFGYPVNTEIGNAQLPKGTLLGYAGNDMPVSAASVSHGCHISVANTWAKRTITMQTGRQVQLTLDGSFIAGTLAAMVASFPTSYETLLRKVIPGFDEIQTFDDVSLRLVGPYGFIILQQNGAVVKVLSAETHDKSAPDYREINVMTQKQRHNAVVRERMDAAVISLTPASQADGEVLVRSALFDILSSMVSQGEIGKYQNANGDVRTIDANTDIRVSRDENDPTLYKMAWNFFTRFTIVRLTGLYTVNEEKLFS